MDPNSRFQEDILDGILESVLADDLASTIAVSSDEEDYYAGEMFATRFYGDNLDSYLGSDHSEDELETGISWTEEYMSRPSSPQPGIWVATTPDTVGEVAYRIESPYPETCGSTKGGGLTPQHVPVGAPQQIMFEIGTYPTNLQLENLFPKETERRFAIMARDLDLVANHHIKSIAGMGTVVMPQPFSSTPETLLRSKSIPQALAAVINHLSSIKDSLPTELLAMEPGLQGTGTTPTSAWGNWPSNDQFVFVSKLMSNYTGVMAVRTEQAEITDYSLASNAIMNPRELLFDDGCQVQVNRSQMFSMEVGNVCHPAIISAWGRIREHRRNTCGLPTTACLKVVDKLEAEGGSHTMLEHWLGWIISAKIDIHNSQQLFIPIKMGNHYALIVFSFNDDTIQSIVPASPSNEGSWTLFADKVIARVVKLLHKINHKRCNDLNQFTYQLVTPTWSTKDANPDSAIEVMHLMDVYDGNLDSIGDLLLSEEQVRVALKIAYIADIVTSRVSVCRDSALAKLPGFITTKCNHELQPTSEVVKYRKVGGWLSKV